MDDLHLRTGKTLSVRRESLDRLVATLTEPFRDGSRIDIRLVVVFLAINSLVLVNAWLHDPKVGYDANSYLEYIRTLSTFRSVTPQDSREFFSPPLPFSLPALLMGVWNLDIVRALKIAQYLNAVLSVGLTWYLLRIGALLEDRATLRLATLGFLGVLPVYYKSFAFVRGEPMVAFFSVVILYYGHRMFAGKQFTTANAAILGLCMGLSILSRQWGVLLIPAVFLLFVCAGLQHPELRRAIAKAIALSGLAAAVIGGWFYLQLQQRFGSSLAFNKSPETSFSFANQPMDFYFGLSPGLLFSRPFRPHFANQFIPIFYSEVWGDYWGDFSVASSDSRSGDHISGLQMAAILDTGSRPDWFETNYDTMVPYLGSVNVVSLFPSLLAVASMGWVALGALRSLRNEHPFPEFRAVHATWLIAVMTIMAGYAWFLIMYPNPGKGSTIKATYLLQLFPIVSLMVGVSLEGIRRHSRILYILILLGLTAVVAHNLPAMVTHY